MSPAEGDLAKVMAQLSMGQFEMMPLARALQTL